MPSKHKIVSINKKDEIANAITHGLGLILAIIGVTVFFNFFKLGKNDAPFWGVVIFSFALILTYLASTVYHLVWNLSYRKTFRIIDHISIYLLIAGTNTPFVLLYLDNKWGTTYLIVLWSLVLLGIILKIFLIGKYNLLDAMYYLFLGWMGVLLVPVLIQGMSLFSISMIGLGGLSYSIGVYFYLKDDRKYFHAIWHLFVIGGSACHYTSLLASFDII